MKNTKHQKKLLTSVILTVCTFFVTLVGCSSNFEGNSVKNEDVYVLDIETMNGTDTHTLALTEGDILQIQFETVKGSLNMEIKAPDGTSIYQGNGRETTEFTLGVSEDGLYTISVEGKKAQGSIRVDVEKAPETTEPTTTSEQESETTELTMTSEQEPESTEPTTASEQDHGAVATERLVGPWHLAEGKKDNDTAIEAISGAMESGNSMEITSDGYISWHIGTECCTGTYSLDGNVLSADMTNDSDGSSMKMEFTVEETDGVISLYTEYKGLLLCWSQGDDCYPGEDVVEIVNLRGDKTTVYKLADGTYMDRIDRRFTYNGTDTWTDEDGVEWNAVVE